MKPRRFFILLMLALCWIAIPASASRLGDIRVNARFLTDRMAYELRLSNRQYEDVFEINYDFFYNVDPYVRRMSYGDPYALDMYYRFLDERNDDLRWVLSRKKFVHFMSLNYFFRPIYAVNRICYIRIYNIYPNHNHFYFGRPSHYYSYHGGHCRHHHGGVSFYRRNYDNHYYGSRHSVYTGSFESRHSEVRHRDFPTGNQNVRPGTTVERPIRSNRNSVVTEGNRTNHSNVGTSHRTYEDRSHRSTVSHRSQATEVNHHDRHSEVSHRSHGSEVSHRSNRSSVRQHSSSSRSRSESRSSSRSERSERRGARER